MASELVEAVLTESVGLQYLAGFLVGMGVGGVVGASTLGVAMFSLIAPEGQLSAFTAVVPVVNCMGNLGTISVYVQHANWKLCWSMWPWIIVGIGIGTLILPLLAEAYLRKLTSIIYGLVLTQRVYEKWSEMQQAKLDVKGDKKNTDFAAQRKLFYQLWWVSASVSVVCGIVTVVTNNSGPIVNLYLLACGLNMDQFVATRSVMMAGKNFAKVAARGFAGGLSLDVLLHGVKIGLVSFVGIQVAKPIKSRTNPEFYVYFTWVVLAYTCVKMWA